MQLSRQTNAYGDLDFANSETASSSLPGAQPEQQSLSAHAPIRVQALSCWEEFEKYRAEWERLLLESDDSSIFSTPEWLQAYWHAYGKGRTTKCLLFLGHDDKVVGLAGLYSEAFKTPVGKKLRRLSFVGDGTFESVCLDFIVQPGCNSGCIQAFVDWLSSQKDWDVCELNTLSQSSPNLNELLSLLARRKWKYTTFTAPSSAAPLADSWEAYLQQIPRKERSKIRHRTKELEFKFQVSVTRCEQEADLPRALENLFTLHQKRWVQRGQMGAFSSPERCAFYQEMARAFLKRGWLEFWQLALDDKPVACQFGFRYKDTVQMLQKGFDPDYADSSVGYVLEAHVIKALISEGVRCYDYLWGGEFSKTRMGAQAVQYVNLQFAKPFSMGAMALAMDRAKRATKAYLREKLPEKWLATLKGISGAPGVKKAVAENQSSGNEPND